jgi:hypothetical protein
MAYSSIVKPSVYFNTKLYTGNGGTNAITGVGFQPDFNWLKNRSNTGEHILVDAVRGMYNIRSNSTTAQSANGSSHQQSLDSDGFTVAGTGANSNANGNTFASWNWKANGAGSANTDGSITSTVSANTTSGFSIVSYTGGGASATIGHGLGVAPKMIIIKCTDSTDKWIVYHNSIGNTKYLVLNNTDAQTTDSAHFNNTSPTNSVFSVGTSGATSGNGQHFIAYCFAEKTGYSKFGSYVGNGNNDGTFVYTGFKPAWVMVKRADSASVWQINDTKRDPYNKTTHTLFPHLSDAESATGWFVDYVSNGFKIRDTGTAVNASSGTYIYMAFAEEPLVANSGTDGVPATAR